MSSSALAIRAAELRAARIPFVHARVVLAERPTSAKPGDEAIVTGDGAIDGFVGGSCAETTVRTHSLALLDPGGPAGEPLLLRITPDGPDGPDGPGNPTPDTPGRLTVHNPCLSGGSLEIFLDPVVPLPLMLVLASGPIADALARVAAAMDMDVRVVDQATAEASVGEAQAVVVASHGRDEPPVLTAALTAGVPYVALVASRKRGRAVLAELPLDDEQLQRVHTPAGLDIGARTASEIAVSICAELVSERRRTATENACVAPVTPETAIDPVCGMTVSAVDASLHLDHNGTPVYFCGTGCQAAYAADPSRFATATE